MMHTDWRDNLLVAVNVLTALYTPKKNKNLLNGDNT